MTADSAETAEQPASGGGTGTGGSGIRGTGPGVIAPDGSAVEFYATMPPEGEPEIIHSAIPARATILELGSGAGRITHPLVALGHRVVAVDESAEMLARIHGAETVRARFGELELAERFDVVLLASYFVNVPSDVVRHELLRTCRRYSPPGSWMSPGSSLPFAGQAWRLTAT